MLSINIGKNNFGTCHLHVSIAVYGPPTEMNAGHNPGTRERAMSPISRYVSGVIRLLGWRNGSANAVVIITRPSAR